MSDPVWYEHVPVPWLMRDAREVYRASVGRWLANAGCDDIPRNGSFVLAGLDQGKGEPTFSPQAEVVASLGVSKQAASQLIDTLVLRDYLERRIDPEDRRRMEIRLTSRGRSAVLAIRSAIDEVDTAVAQMLTEQELRGFRMGLAAFRRMREQPGH